MYDDNLSQLSKVHGYGLRLNFEKQVNRNAYTFRTLI